MVITKMANRGCCHTPQLAASSLKRAPVGFGNTAGALCWITRRDSLTTASPLPEQIYPLLTM
jgi:hypothetical protein